MDWNRQQQLLQKWQPFGIPQMHLQQQQHQLHQQMQAQQQQHQQQQQPLQPPQAHQQPAPSSSSQPPPPPPPVPAVAVQIPQVPREPKVSKTGGSSTPHCLVCNVHLGMFAKGGMEIFSEKVTTTQGKLQIHSILSTIVNQELNTNLVHSSIICKKCFKLIDDIDAIEDQLISMKQVISSKYTMTLALVKKGMVGKAVIDDITKTLPPPRVKKPKPPPAKRGRKKRKVGRPRKTDRLTVKSGRVVKKVQDDDSNDDDDVDGIDEGLDEVAQIEEGSIEQFQEGSSFMCSVCDKVFDTSEALIAHMEDHGLKDNWFSCTICDKTFISEESLKKHSRRHRGSKKRKAKSKALKKVKPPPKIYECKHCSKVFSTELQCQNHETGHTGEKPYECDVCGTAFRLKSNLTAHKKVTHLQLKRFKCGVCEKEFKWKRLLTAHTMSVHTGERPYRCEFCDHGFVFQQHFKKHMRIHTGEKPFKCEICGKAFNSSENCRAHKFTHSDKKPYECRICGAGFMRKPLVLTHIKQHSHIDDDSEKYVKSNSPGTSASQGEGGNDASQGAKKKMKTNSQNQGIHAAQGSQQNNQGDIAEYVQNLILPEQIVNKEQPHTSEAMNYVLGSFQSQAPMAHYTSLNLGQW